MHIKQNKILGLLFFCCMIALSTAFIAEYLFDMQSCALCTYQRYVFAAAALIAILGAKFLDVPRFIVFTMLCILFIINSGLASYQVALEYGWIEESIFCKTSASLINVQSLEELRKTLIAEGFQDCAKPEQLFFGMSIAFYNIIFSLGLAIISIFGLLKSEIKL